MKKITQYLFVIVMALGQSLFQVDFAYAVTANPRATVYTQPDGSKLTINLRGDEFIHWAETSDGFTIITTSKGTYEYAAFDSRGYLVFSGMQAHNPSERNQQEISLLRNTKKGLFFSGSQIKEMKELLINGGAPHAPLMGGFPSTGTRKLLMILANFNNTTTTYTQTDFGNYMNQVNYNGTGSFKDYYLEVSYGQLIVNTTVTVWVTLPNTHDYYGPDTKWGEFAYDAVVAANNQAAVNFSEFDNDLDGIVDGVAIIHQGQGQEETGNVLDIWSHSWDLTSAGYTTLQRTFDGVEVDAYTTMPEKNASGMGTIGVMCHEFCHNLGSPDFYDTDYGTGGSYAGTGNWDLMASGSWNGVSGTKPAHPNAWIKAFLNWTTPTVLSSAQATVLRNAQVYTDVVRYNTTTPNEYFLCENRQQTGFDAGIPGHGLIIYHADGAYIAAHSASNDINATSHQGLYPVSAGASGNPPTTYGTINGTSCPFPGSGSKTTFSDATTPHSHSWAGANTNFPLSAITENVSTKEISFCFVSCSAPNDPVNFTAAPASTSQINLSWGLNAGSNAVLVACNTSATFGTPVTGTNYSSGNSISEGGTVLYNGTNTTFNHAGLNPNTTYYYKAWSVLPGITYSSGVVANAATLCSVLNVLPVTETFTSGTLPGCWTQADNQGNGQIWQFGIITGQSPNPALTGNYAYLNSDAYGSGNSQNADLVSPMLDLTAYSAVTLQFNHYFEAYPGSSGKLYYSINNGSSWTLISTFSTTSPSNPVSFSQAISAVAGQPMVKFKWNYTGTWGYSWSIDDIQVTCPPFTANFTAGSLTPPKNVTVQFTDQSTGGATSWNWSFDRPSVTFVNGTSASSQHPQVQFTDGGPYTVTLQAGNPCFSDSEVKSAYMRAGISGLWTGNTSTEWTTLTNWDNWLAPIGSTDVVIPASAPNWPVFTGDLIFGTHCHNLTLSGPASRLTVTGNITMIP